MRGIFSGSNASWLEEISKEHSGETSSHWSKSISEAEHELEGYARKSAEPITPKSTDSRPSTDKITGTAKPDISRIRDKQHRVDALVDAYRELGHLYANINPLGAYMPPNLRYAWITQQGIGKELDPAAYGLDEEDMDTRFSAPTSFHPPVASLRQIIERMKAVYTSHIGAEFLHIRNRPMRRWIIEQLEGRRDLREISIGEKRRWQRDLIRSEEFESFIHSRYTGQKRFSLEGSEVLIPALRYLFTESGRRNIREVVMGMTHRGRLNVLANAMVKPVVEIFAMFQGNYEPHIYGGSGDVKYHLGQSIDYVWEEGKTLHISLVSNPSHLEAVDPVVQGKARGTQRFRNDATRKKILPILIHGDAAFSGQGVVAETFNMSQLRGYRTGGTIHIVANNQIGFTTASSDSRSSFFATDIAKIMPVPIFHANGDKPEAVMKAVELALRWRQKFGQDVVIDIIAYRRLGHNEADEPSFTHPIMYEMIKNHQMVSQSYGQKLAENGVFPMDEQKAFRIDYVERLKSAREEAREYSEYHGFQTLSGDWSGVKREYSFDFPETGVPLKTLKEVSKTLLSVPEGFRIHRKLERFIENRRKVIESGEGLDWAFAESLAFGTLLLEGRSVRLSGEDCGRGTFSQRHAVWWDISSETPRQYTPLTALARNEATFTVYDSPLSEFSILGFEYGYSIAQPEILVLWEAQFGDFANGAQVIIDQFVSAGESKWARHSGLVMLLPHAYEGQGPEHSNAYLERYLSLCAENNIQVVNLTTPAQYFHVLRKQLHQEFRKPLIIMTPKRLLRLPEARSSLTELTSGCFHCVLDDGVNKDAERLILCSGHIWYDLIEARGKGKINNTRILKLEQFYPFPGEELYKLISASKSAKHFLWVQEEPKNRGGWSFLNPLLKELTGRDWKYIGREASASPATGSYEKHQSEKEQILSEALGESAREG